MCSKVDMSKTQLVQLSGQIIQQNCCPPSLRIVIILTKMCISNMPNLPSIPHQHTFSVKPNPELRNSEIKRKGEYYHFA